MSGTSCSPSRPLCSHSLTTRDRALAAVLALVPESTPGCRQRVARVGAVRVEAVRAEAARVEAARVEAHQVEVLVFLARHTG